MLLEHTLAPVYQISRNSALPKTVECMYPYHSYSQTAAVGVSDRISQFGLCCVFLARRAANSSSALYDFN
jgi:hypothetical protein